MLRLVVQSYPTLCEPMDCVHGDAPGKNTGVGCHAILQGVFKAQGLNPGLCIVGRFFTVWATKEAP